MIVMLDIEKKAWETVFALWRHLGTTDYDFSQDHDINRAQSIKHDILEKLGYERCAYGCPFCDVFFHTSSCPLGVCEKDPGCYNYSYEDWECFINAYKKNNRRYALKFYYELITVFLNKCKEETI